MNSLSGVDIYQEAYIVPYCFYHFSMPGYVDCTECLSTEYFYRSTYMPRASTPAHGLYRTVLFLSGQGSGWSAAMVLSSEGLRACPVSGIILAVVS